MEYPHQIIDLINSLKKIPGVGSKSAERMAFDILSMEKEKKDDLVNSIVNIENIKRCKICGNLSDEDVCGICNTRDTSTICVVNSCRDVNAFEKMKEYEGVYHVLNGYINPNKNITPDSINLNSLIERVNTTDVKEVILATDLTVEGEITAMYISKLLEKSDVKVTRLAHGLPMGAQLDYADELTLFKAFSNRKDLTNK